MTNLKINLTLYKRIWFTNKVKNCLDFLLPVEECDCSSFVPLQDSLEPPLKEMESGISFYNTLHCEINIKTGDGLNFKIAPYQVGWFLSKLNENPCAFCFCFK